LLEARPLLLLQLLDLADHLLQPVLERVHRLLEPRPFLRWELREVLGRHDLVPVRGGEGEAGGRVQERDPLLGRVLAEGDERLLLALAHLLVHLLGAGAVLVALEQRRDRGPDLLG